METPGTTVPPPVEEPPQTDLPPQPYESEPNGDIEIIPPEIIVEIVKLADFRGVCQLQKVNKRLYKIIHEAALQTTVNCEILVRKCLLQNVTNIRYDNNDCQFLAIDNEFVEYVGQKTICSMIPWLSYTDRNVNSLQKLRLHICSKCKSHLGNVGNGFRGNGHRWTIFFRVICGQCDDIDPVTIPKPPLVEKLIAKRNAQVQRNKLYRPKMGRLNHLTAFIAIHTIKNGEVILDNCFSKY